MEVEIRKAQAGDAVSIAKFLRGLGWFPHIEAQSAQDTRENVARHLALCITSERHSVYLAHDSRGELVGYGSVHWLPTLFLAGPEGYVSELFVGESQRGRGIGGRLLAAMEAEARARGCSRLIALNLRTRESYRRGFYHKHGWKERQEAANFIYSL